MKITTSLFALLGSIAVLFLISLALPDGPVKSFFQWWFVGLGGFVCFMFYLWLREVAKHVKPSRKSPTVW